MTNSKIQNLYDALVAGDEISPKQGVRRFGFKNENVFRAAISTLRNDDYVPIRRWRNVYGTTKYAYKPTALGLISVDF